MNGDHRTTRMLVAAAAAMLLLAAGAARSDEKDVIATGSATVPFQTGTQTLDLPAQPIVFAGLHVDVKPPNKKGMQKVLLKLPATNVGDEDFFVFLTVTLLGEGETELASDREKAGIEEDDSATVTMKFTLPSETVASLRKVRLDMSIEED